MYTLVIGRAFPRKETGMMGIFEFEQAAALSKYGMKTVYAFCDTRSVKRLRKYNYEEFVRENVPVYGYHYPIGGLPVKLFNQLKFFKYKKMIHKIIKSHGKPSIIHIHFPLIAINKKIFTYLKRLDIPIVVTEHWSKVQNQTIEKHRVDLLKILVKQSSAFICVGKKLRDSVLELTKENNEIYIIPNFVSNDFYLKDLSKIKNKNDFIFVGRFVKEKNIEKLILAFKNEFQNSEDVNLKLVGNGPYYNEIKKIIETQSLMKTVRMYGNKSRKETADLISHSDFYISASEVETFGVPFVEAMACGKPVICHSECEISRFISSKVGVTFKGEDIKDLQNAMRSVYENRSGYNAEEISKFANEIFSEEAVVNKTLELYTQLR